MAIKIALIGAGSASFAPGTIRDIFLSDALNACGVDLALMDIAPEHLPEREAYARRVAARLGRDAKVAATTDLDEALEGASHVVTAIDLRRYLHWSQDFHIPRQYGFLQIFGENGGPGGLFHALRNMGPMVKIARRMEALCPEGTLINFSNPESKLVQAVSLLTKVRAVGLCHGVTMGENQIADFLQMGRGEIDAAACGINHFTWFQRVRSRATGEDLYPRLREQERRANPMAQWDELMLSRILLRVFGLWPSPGTNHHGEYIRWAGEFFASDALQYFYDPADGHPWETGREARFLYSLGAGPIFGGRTMEEPLFPEEKARHGAATHGSGGKEEEIRPSGEYAVAIMEALSCGGERDIPAVVVLNRGTGNGIWDSEAGRAAAADRAMPGMDGDVCVEVPARIGAGGILPHRMETLPEGVTALLRVQGSIQKILVEAFAEGSRRKLLQAMLLDPTVDSYRNAVACIDEMLRLQKDVLPAMGWEGV